MLISKTIGGQEEEVQDVAKPTSSTKGLKNLYLYSTCKIAHGNTGPKQSESMYIIKTNSRNVNHKSPDGSFSVIIAHIRS